MVGKSAGVSTMAPTRRIDSARPSGTVRPSSRTDPFVGRASPSTQRIVVVFPDPLGPRKPNTPPSGTVRSSPSIATVRPRLRRYSLRSPSISMTFVPIGPSPCRRYLVPEQTDGGRAGAGDTDAD